MASFSEELIRGIPTKDFIDEDGNPLASMFQFDECKGNDILKASITWFDNQEALDIISSQINKKGELQFSAGLAILKRGFIDDLMTRMTAKNRINYEREELEDNIYHGNITMIKGLDSNVRAMLRGQIASCVCEIIPNKFVV